MEKSQQVGRDQGIEILSGKVREGLGVEDSGVVYQNIDGSKVVDRCFHRFGGGLLLTNIAIDKNQAG